MKSIDCAEVKRKQAPALCLPKRALAHKPPCGLARLPAVKLPSAHRALCRADRPFPVLGVLNIFSLL